LVNAGDQVRISYYSVLKFSVAAKYSAVDGTEFLKVPENALYNIKYPVAWRYNAFVPWRRSMNTAVRRYC
jgi:hypothetical protein